MNRIEKEQKLVGKMIRIYCRHIHGSRFFLWNNARYVLCPACEVLFAYACIRLKNCRYGVNKPVCSACTTHCYQADMQEKMRAVMRYSGPRMGFMHPYDTLQYLINKKRF